LAGFPASRSARYFALSGGLKRMATRAGIQMACLATEGIGLHVVKLRTGCGFLRAGEFDCKPQRS
jgi:hypothetical protein